MTGTGDPGTRRAGADGAGTARERGIGRIGTAARLAAGLVLLGLVAATQAHRGFEPLAWILPVTVFPAVLLAGQRLRSRRFPASMRATGPLGHAVNVAVFLALYLPGTSAPPLRPLSDAVLIFYAASMLLAAIRGYAGCEVLAVPNWLLRRDDQVGCVIFSPVDQLERRREDPVPVSVAGERSAGLRDPLEAAEGEDSGGQVGGGGDEQPDQAAGAP
jgi:hypothetical protein